VAKARVKLPNGQFITNFDLLNEHVGELVKFLDTWPPSTYKCKEYLMVLSDSQVRALKLFLADPHVKEVDHFLNKAHGPATLHVYRISCQKDFR
jgi:hypothetical protein